jgi:hypothetical protein
MLGGVCGLSHVIRRVAPLALLLPLSGCGYSLAGHGSFLPPYIQTIGIPVFINRTSYFELEQRLTEKVRAEFIGRGNYKILPQNTGIDGLLLGEITGVGLYPTAFTSEQQAARYVIVLSARIQFKDMTTNKIIWENPSLSFREDYEAAGGTDALDPNAFFGQESNAFGRVMDDFARSLVSAILEAF